MAIDLYNVDSQPIFTLPKDDLKTLSLWAIENIFTDGVNFYKQTKGASMGGCISPILVQIYMDNLMSKILKLPLAKFILFL